METVILLFLLASLDKNSSLQASLRNFLGFYKENRELISMLTKTAQGSPSEAAPQTAQGSSPQAGGASSAETKKESPPERGSLDVLDAYLKRCAV